MKKYPREASKTVWPLIFFYWTEYSNCTGIEIPVRILPRQLDFSWLHNFHDEFVTKQVRKKLSLQFFPPHLTFGLWFGLVVFFFFFDKNASHGIMLIEQVDCYSEDILNVSMQWATDLPATIGKRKYYRITA